MSELINYIQIEIHKTYDKKEIIEAAKKLGFLTIHLTDPEIINHEINRFIKFKHE